MSDPHWNEWDPAEDESYPRVEAAEPGQQDEFPADWGAEPTERDQEALDSGAADEALFQGLIDAGWSPPPAGAHAQPGDADPATATIDAGAPAGYDDADFPADLPLDESDIVGLPHWE